ncbi:MAG: hypothetical protein M1812_008314 [Candelaria pacifica]|nr:MAG: hypothetical protein M1812_008314 [Candelaria pacifica]
MKPMVSGTAKSEPGFEPKLDAEFVGNGMDYIHNDPDGKRMRLDAHQVLRNNDGALFKLGYTGIIDMTPELEKILGGSPDAKTTEFGSAFTHLTFETGAESLKELETSVFVSSGRFVIKQGEKPVVEYKVSKAIKG